MELEFEDQWIDGSIQGWEDRGIGCGSGELTIDMDDYDSVDELVELGPEKLKQVT